MRTEELTHCDFCDDAHCMDDFITGECPATESTEDCGCAMIFDTETGDELAIIHRCKFHEDEAKYWEALNDKDGEK